MELKSGYKQTEAGVIPQEWEPKTLGELFALRNGFAFSSAFFSSNGPIVLTPGNFRLDGGLYFDDGNTKRYSGTYDPSLRFDDGDLLIVMTDLTPDCNLLGKPAFVHADEVILHNQRIGKVLLKTRSIRKDYLFYVLLSRPYLARLRELATGSTVRHTSNKSIYSVWIPLPTTSEQDAITKALSGVDALISALDKLIAKKRDLKQAAMQQLLTGKQRLPGFSGKWEVKPFGDLFKKLNSKLHQIQTPDYSPHGDFPVIDQGQSTIVAYSDQSSKVFHCPQGGVIVFGDHTRIVKFVDYDFLVGADGTQVLKVQAGNSTKFFFYQLSVQEIPNTGYNRHFKFLKETTLAAPPLAEQDAITKILSDMDTEIAAVERMQNKARGLKQGMMQVLLTGKTRLI